MKTHLALALTTTALSIAACGGSSSGGGAPVSDKTSAADAAYRLQTTNDGLRARGGQGLRAAQVPDLGGVGAGGVSTDQAFTVRGASGTAEVTIETGITQGDVSTQLTVRYVGYSADGATVLDGEVTQLIHVATGESAAHVRTELSGAVDIRGELDGYLELDVSIEVSAGASTAAVTVDGTISADGTTYTYDGDAFTFTGRSF